jgi:class 3 adenylate cyclase
MAALGLSKANRTELENGLRRISGFGSTVIVGWRYLADGLQFLHVSTYELPRIAKRFENLLHSARYLPDRGDWELAIKMGCRSTDLKLSFGINESAEIQHFVNELLGRYSVTAIDCRAVALFDMVSFSIHSPFEQITQINVLSNAIIRAANLCKRAEMPVDVRLSTTGDGFYVWNNLTGLWADVALYCTACLAITLTAAARQLAEPNTVPKLRACIGTGSHYEYYQATGASQERSSYIVGDVTIELARLIGSALDNQLLLSDAVRDLDGDDLAWGQQYGVTSIDAPAFAALVQEHLQRLKGLSVPGGKIGTFKTYLTGPRQSESSFAIRKYYVTDKHGLNHGCYNAKLNAVLEKGTTLHYGLLDRDLDGFKARWDENEDIVIRVV